MYYKKFIINKFKISAANIAESNNKRLIGLGKTKIKDINLEFIRYLKL